jgi:hypothetical protein
LAIIDCDFADFNGVDLCRFDKLKFVTLTNTENNFEEQNYKCARNKIGDLTTFNDFI